jgi:hypothetical protein
MKLYLYMGNIPVPCPKSTKTESGFGLTNSNIIAKLKNSTFLRRYIELCEKKYKYDEWDKLK